MNNNVKTDTIVRTICLALALLNQILSATGHSPLPITDRQVEVMVTTTITIAMAVWNWWKNNSFTPAAIEADKLMKKLKAGK